MTTLDVLRYGHRTVETVLEGLPDAAWERPGVCGVWSVKDILAHLASFEQVLSEVLAQQRDASQETPSVDRFCSSPAFNDEEVALRSGKSPTETLAEYEGAHAQVMARARALPARAFRLAGALPWYGQDYDLDDFIVYTFYGHKREHCAQIALYRKRLAAGGS